MSASSDTAKRSAMSVRWAGGTGRKPYSESQYFSWHGRNLTQISAGFSAGIKYKKDALITFVKLGAEHGFLMGGKSAGYNNNGAIGSFADSASSDTQRTIAIGVDYESKKRHSSYRFARACQLHRRG